MTSDAAAHDDQIQSQGVDLVHYKAMRCPVGIVDPDDNLRPHEHHKDCHNGWVLKKVGEITTYIQGNGHGTTLADVGRLEGSTAHATFPRFYNDKPDQGVALIPFDRLYYADEATQVETFESFKLGATGKDRLRFEATTGVFLMDSNGKEYSISEYSVAGGYLTWVQGSWPGEGTVVSIRYLYKPYWVVSQLVHELRIQQQIDGDGNRVSTRFPQQAVIQREYYFRDTENDPQNPRMLRQEIEPEDDFGDIV